MNKLRLGISPITDRVYAGYVKDNGQEWKPGKYDVTEDFKRCIVLYCTEQMELEIAGMKFRVACERIE